MRENIKPDHSGRVMIMANGYLPYTTSLIREGSVVLCWGRDPGLSEELTYSCGTALDLNQLPPLCPRIRAAGHLNTIQLEKQTVMNYTGSNERNK